MTREEAINAITAFVENYACGSDLDGLREAIEALKEQRPHGEWIDYQDEKYSYLANCSKCGYQMDTHEERGYFNFCPNCGADMREGEAE